MHPHFLLNLRNLVFLYLFVCVLLVCCPCQLQDGSRQMALLVENQRRSINEGTALSANADQDESEANGRRASTNLKRGLSSGGLFKKLSFFSEV